MSQSYVYIPILTLWIFGALGMADDLLKLRRRNNMGAHLPAKACTADSCIGSAVLHYENSDRLEMTSVSTFWDPSRKLDIGMWFSYRISAVYGDIRQCGEYQ